MLRFVRSRNPTHSHLGKRRSDWRFPLKESSVRAHSKLVQSGGGRGGATRCYISAVSGLASDRRRVLYPPVSTEYADRGMLGGRLPECFDVPDN